MATESRWRSHARAVIAEALREFRAANPSATQKEILKAVNDRYPYGERARLPYKHWRTEMRLVFGPALALEPPRPPFTGIGPEGVWCDWCDSSGCLGCFALRERLASFPWAEWLDLGRAWRTDPSIAGVLADYLEERGLEAEAAAWRLGTAPWLRGA